MYRLLMLIIVLILLLANLILADTPQLVNYQGTLLDNFDNPVADGSYSVTFTFYDASSGGSVKWSETQSVNTIDGGFIALLGSVNPLHDSVFNTIPRYLGIQAGSDAEMYPRTAITTAPWSFRTSTIDGTTGGAITGGLTIAVDELVDGNAIIITNLSGDTLFRAAVDNSGQTSLAIWEVGDIKDQFGMANTKKLELSQSGITMFGATASDTTFNISAAGDIQAAGALQMGEQSSGSGAWSVVLGYNNLASGDTSSVTGGAGNIAEGLLSHVGGGKRNFARGDYSVISGGGGLLAADSNSASGVSSSVAGGRGNVAGDYVATVGGGGFNLATGQSATISGGATNLASNTNSTVGGGGANEASGFSSTISGGSRNKASGSGATVGGGWYNYARGTNSVIAGGGSGGEPDSNSAQGHFSVIIGGKHNYTTGRYGVVAGGYENEADSFAFAAGHQAKATDAHSFVWSDGSILTRSYGTQTFAARSTGGVTFYTNADTLFPSGVYLSAGGGAWQVLSDQDSKTNISEVDYQLILQKVDQLPISEWGYKSQDESIRHIGPMAQDFHELFGVGEDNRHLSTLDPDGVALAAIKALNKKNKQLETELKELRILVEELARKND